LNLSQASLNGSSTPYTEAIMASFASVFLGLGKKQAKNLVSTSFQQVRLWLGYD